MEQLKSWEDTLQELGTLSRSPNWVADGQNRAAALSNLIRLSGALAASGSAEAASKGKARLARLRSSLQQADTPEAAEAVEVVAALAELLETAATSARVAVRRGREAQARTTLAQRALGVLVDGRPRRTSELAELLTVSEPAASRALRRLLAEGAVRNATAPVGGDGRGTWWVAEAGSEPAGQQQVEWVRIRRMDGHEVTFGRAHLGSLAPSLDELAAASG